MSKPAKSLQFAGRVAFSSSASTCQSCLIFFICSFNDNVPKASFFDRADSSTQINPKAVTCSRLAKPRWFCEGHCSGNEMPPNKASLFSVQINPAHSKLRKKMSPGGASEGAALTAWTPIAARISSHRLGGLDNLEIQNKSTGGLL